MSRICKEQEQQNTQRTNSSINKQANEPYKQRNTEGQGIHEKMSNSLNHWESTNDITLIVYLTTDRMVTPRK